MKKRAIHSEYILSIHIVMSKITMVNRTELIKSLSLLMLLLLFMQIFFSSYHHVE